ncbi:glycosyltransferase [Candidatus Chazhemtobacterium aquaticus]|uniref:Glycosyl transferase family 2 n=1 Tax=Candidatus Chazhemtobacterium aquaticus TaxID=2715735 RepID=A0A857N5T9_9BACT|nr:glycosyltransferase [Candidatus Chazhemtobacterium aquaticus]QHO63497.1 Glycosyl transferase family 2 [Candidatus Chazhemtobacterium aquaticus]
MKSALPLVSVVITTKNEEKHIVSCLKSIKNQDYPREKIEIIVVDNHSTDDTVKLAKQYTKNIFTKGPERSAQRNYGMITKSHGQYVMYVDADMELSKKVISSCVSKVTKNPDIIGLYIREIVTGDSYWSKVRRFERSFYEGTVIDCVRFIKKSAFVKVKGFDKQITGGEDWDLDKKIRQLGKVDLIKQPIYHNEAEFNLKKYLAKKSYYSKGLDIYIKKWGKDDPDVKKQFSPIYRLVVVFLERGKWQKLLHQPRLVLGMALLRIGVGFSYVKHQVISK